SRLESQEQFAVHAGIRIGRHDERVVEVGDRLAGVALQDGRAGGQIHAIAEETRSDAWVAQAAVDEEGRGHRPAGSSPAASPAACTGSLAASVTAARIWGWSAGVASMMLPASAWNGPPRTSVTVAP